MWEFIITKILPVILSFIAIFLSYKAWHKSRAIYGVERLLFFRKSDKHGQNNNDKLNKKLSSGKYTILHTQNYGNDVELILGKLKDEQFN